LESTILKKGCVIPILAWNGYLVDGQQSYSIYQKHHVPFKVFEGNFKSVEDAQLWIYENLLNEDQRTQCQPPNPPERSEHPVPEEFLLSRNQPYRDTNLMIPPHRIRLDCGTQSRTQINEDIIARYAEAMERGEKFQPILVFQESPESDYILVDGFHRYYAHQKIQPDMLIAAKIRTGNIEEARWASFEANATHGMPRSDDDKRKAVESAVLHQTGQNLSNYLIAEHVKVSESTVRRIRLKMKPVVSTESTTTTSEAQSAVRIGRDGRTIDTTKIGKVNQRRVKPDIKSGLTKSEEILIDKKIPVNPVESEVLPHEPTTSSQDFFASFEKKIPSDLVHEIMVSSLSADFIDDLPIAFLNALEELPQKKRYEQILKKLRERVFHKLNTSVQYMMMCKWFDQLVSENENHGRSVLEYLEIKLNRRYPKKSSKKQ
jgi:DNA-binding CsgD family transcriptional regulator